VLLWARLASVPPGSTGFSLIVGFWHKSIERWKVAPELLNRDEELIRASARAHSVVPKFECFPVSRPSLAG
jgi:hypothetical protein